MKAKNKTIYSRTLRVEEVRAPQDKPNTKALDRFEERRKFVSIADQVAQSTTWTRNYKWTNTEYPNHPDMRIVDKCYPYAKGGMLLVDEPADMAEAERCYSKQKILKKMGIRHIVVEADTFLEHALQQIGEL